MDGLAGCPFDFSENKKNLGARPRCQGLRLSVSKDLIFHSRVSTKRFRDTDGCFVVSTDSAFILIFSCIPTNCNSTVTSAPLILFLFSKNHTQCFLQFNEQTHRKLLPSSII
jgi:hypothetical protein